jgi:nucleoid DNA-binding protein
VKALKLTKLIHEIWKDERVKELGLRKGEVELLVKVFLEYIGKNLIKHNVVKLRGLFTLEIRTAKGRRIRDLNTGEETFSKDYKKIGIKPSNWMKEELKKES